MRKALLFILFIAFAFFYIFNAHAKVRNYKIAVIISQIGGDTFPDTQAIKVFVSKKVQQLNAAGGLFEKKVIVDFYDDREKGENTKKIIDKVISDPEVIGIVGLWNSTRAKNIVHIIGTKNIPYIGDFSDNRLFLKYKSIYSMAPSIENELVYFKSFVEQTKASKLAFISREGDRYSEAYSSFVTNDMNRDLCFHYNIVERKLNSDHERKINDFLDKCSPDLLFLSLGSTMNADVVELLQERKHKPAVYTVLGALTSLVAKSPKVLDYKGEIYDLSEKGIPNILNQRLEESLSLFKKDIDRLKLSPLIYGYGARYYDAVSMIIEGAKLSKSPDPKSIRKSVLKYLQSVQVGKGVYRGLAQDWSFLKNRTTAEDILHVWKPSPYRKVMLYPKQVIRLDEQNKEAPVIYMYLDLHRISRVNREQKTFDAVFYFSVYDEAGRFKLEDIEFTNAARGQLDNKPLINARRVDSCIENKEKLCKNKTFKVNGRFDFFPDLTRYPFDTQRFNISFQPQTASNQFYIQPQDKAGRDKDFTVDGWELINHYVGVNKDIIKVTQAYVVDQRIVPLYKFDFTWEMSRTGIGFYLKVCIPALVIIFLAYLSAFVPIKDYGAIATIQVTALLAGIALYFSIDKPSTEYTTISDRIFITIYVTILMMTFITVLRIRSANSNREWLHYLLVISKIYAFPLMVILGIFYSFYHL